MSKYYTPSNNFSPLSFFYFLIACIILIPLLAVIYSYAIWYIPIPYVNLFITAGFGFAVGWSVQFLAIKLGKVRNAKLALLFGIIGSLVALYIHWAIWIDLVLNVGESYGTDRIGIAVSNIKIVQVLNLIMQPAALFEIIGQVQEFGTWGIRGGTVSGTPLTIIWAIEALIILFLGTSVAFGGSSDPFCELNQKWFDSKVLPAFNYLENSEIYLQGLKDGKDDTFDGLQKVVDITNESHSLFTLYSNDTNENYLTIENKRARRTDKDEVKFDSNNVVNLISISEQLSKRMEALSL